MTAEPTSEFNDRCREVLNVWRTGELTYEDAVVKILTLRDEAVEAKHTPNHARGEYLLGYLHHYRGNFRRSLQHYEVSRQLFIQVGNDFRVANCNISMGENYRYMGNFTLARSYYQTAAETSRQLGEHGLEAIAIANEGQVLLSMGQMDDARTTLESALQVALTLPAEDHNRAGLLCEIYYGLARIHLATGKPLEAWNVGKKALDVAEDVREMMQIGFANRALGDALTVLGNSNGSNPDDYYQASLRAFAEVKAEAEQARTVYAQAESLAARGKVMSAARKLQHAMIIFTRLDMADDAAKTAQAQLRILSQP